MALRGVAVERLAHSEFAKIGSRQEALKRFFLASLSRFEIAGGKRISQHLSASLRPDQPAARTFRLPSLPGTDPLLDVHMSRFPAQANSANDGLGELSGDAGFRAVRHSRGDAREQLCLKFVIPLVGDGFRRALLLKIVIERPTGRAHGLG